MVWSYSIVPNVGNPLWKFKQNPSLIRFAQPIQQENEKDDDKRANEGQVFLIAILEGEADDGDSGNAHNEPDFKWFWV